MKSGLVVFWRLLNLLHGDESKCLVVSTRKEEHIEVKELPQREAESPLPVASPIRARGACILNLS